MMRWLIIILMSVSGYAQSTFKVAKTYDDAPIAHVDGYFAGTIGRDQLCENGVQIFGSEVDLILYSVAYTFSGKVSQWYSKTPKFHDQLKKEISSLPDGVVIYIEQMDVSTDVDTLRLNSLSFELTSVNRPTKDVSKMIRTSFFRKENRASKSIGAWKGFLEGHRKNRKFELHSFRIRYSEKGKIVDKKLLKKEYPAFMIALIKRMHLGSKLFIYDVKYRSDRSAAVFEGTPVMLSVTL